jgi:hypothetical protein
MSLRSAFPWNSSPSSKGSKRCHFRGVRRLLRFLKVDVDARGWFAKSSVQDCPLGKIGERDADKDRSL